MGLWTDFRDSLESAASVVSPIDFRSESARKKHSGITGGLNSARDFEEGLFNKATGRMTAEEKRNQQKLISDQINAYKEQTDLARQQLDETRAATEAEKRRVQEKQIRSLRRNYRAQGSGSGVGMLGQGQPASDDMNTKLGG